MPEWEGVARSLVDARYGVLVGYARLVSGGPNDAEDLVQEAWLRFAMYAQHTPVDKPGAFLMRTALNLAMSADRARAVRGEEVEVEELSLLDSAPDTEAVVLARERVTRLGVCLDGMVERTRAIFLDIRYRGASHAEVAERYGISTSAVEKQVAKAAFLISCGMEGW